MVKPSTRNLDSGRKMAGKEFKGDVAKKKAVRKRNAQLENRKRESLV